MSSTVSSILGVTVASTVTVSAVAVGIYVTSTPSPEVPSYNVDVANDVPFTDTPGVYKSELPQPNNTAGNTVFAGQLPPAATVVIPAAPSAEQVAQDTQSAIRAAVSQALAPRRAGVQQQNTRNEVARSEAPRNEAAAPLPLVPPANPERQRPRPNQPAPIGAPALPTFEAPGPAPAANPARNEPAPQQTIWPIDGVDFAVPTTAPVATKPVATVPAAAESAAASTTAFATTTAAPISEPVSVSALATTGSPSPEASPATTTVTETVEFSVPSTAPVYEKPVAETIPSLEPSAEPVTSTPATKEPAPSTTVREEATTTVWSVPTTAPVQPARPTTDLEASVPSTAPAEPAPATTAFETAVPTTAPVEPARPTTDFEAAVPTTAPVYEKPVLTIATTDVGTPEPSAVVPTTAPVEPAYPTTDFEATVPTTAPVEPAYPTTDFEATVPTTAPVAPALPTGEVEGSPGEGVVSEKGEYYVPTDAPSFLKLSAFIHEDGSITYMAPVIMPPTVDADESDEGAETVEPVEEPVANDDHANAEPSTTEDGVAAEEAANGLRVTDAGEAGYYAVPADAPVYEDTRGYGELDANDAESNFGNARHEWTVDSPAEETWGSRYATAER